MQLEPSLVATLRSRLDTMTDQLSRLVSCESPSDDLGLLGRCANEVSDLGTELLGVQPSAVEVDGRTHLVWRLGGPPAVVLVGHYDTVWAAGTIDRWPFRIDSAGRATGPGVFDMKAGIIQMFHALAVLPSRALTSDRAGVAVVLTADEELGSQTSRALIEETARGARAALVLEPSAQGALKVARKGTSMYEVHALGRSSHAGLEPEKGINATVELAHQVLAVAGLGRPEIGTTVTPTVASAGTTTNTVPAAAVLHVDVRATDPAEQERVDGEIRRLTPVVEGSSLRIEGGINRPPLDAAASSSLMTLAVSVAGRLGLDPITGVSVGGASDGNFTAGVGVPTLDGLGADGDGAHAEGEYTIVTAMPERAALVAGMVAEILAANGA
ncbi:MAG TPA: M20 family metallopeptidase [Acidimicrobiales bacterium]|nr:M20 family metallopeptidase [Acidimicrobiales bacterium]